MRTFVIVTPGLSVGRPGSHVRADKLHMDDDKLDEFVEAGHAIEVFDERSPRPVGREPAQADTDLASLAAKPKPKPRKRSGG